MVWAINKVNRRHLRDKKERHKKREMKEDVGEKKNQKGK